MTIGELIDRVRAYHPAAPVDLILHAPFLKDTEKEAILSGNLIKLLRITS